MFLNCHLQKNNSNLNLGDNLKAVLQNYPNLDIKEALQCVVDIENILKTDEIDIFDF